MTNEQYPKVHLYRRIVQAKLFIDSHYAENIDINLIADEAYFSKFHFLRLFKQIYGKTPHQYLTLVRIEKAKGLLKNGTSVSEVCSSLGFESLSSFSGLFKRMAGITPSAYLAQQQYRKMQIQKSPLQFIPACFVSQHGLDKK